MQDLVSYTFTCTECCKDFTNLVATEFAMSGKTVTIACPFCANKFEHAMSAGCASVDNLVAVKIAQICDDSLHKEADTGRVVGNEVW